MALIVSTTRTVANGGKSLKCKCDTLVFENEEEGAAFVKENKGLVTHYQKARLIHEQRDN